MFGTIIISHYAHYVNEKERFVRTEIDEFNKLRIYEKSDGIVTVNEGDTIKMKYVLKDYNNNKSVLNFTLVGTTLPKLKTEEILPRSYYRIYDGESTKIYLDAFESDIPEFAFYRDVELKTARLDTIKNIYSYYAYQLGSEEIPLHKKITIRLKPKKEYISDSGLYVAALNRKGEFVFLGNKIINDFIEAKTNVLGVYLIAKDTIKPTIKPVNFKDNSSIAENWSLRVEIEDKETGINKYSMYVNDEWVLADYDAKNKLLVYQIDSHIKKGHNDFKVIVTDMVGNETVYQTILQR